MDDSPKQSAENRHRFWLRLRHAVILISKVRTSVSKKINLMPLIRTLTISTTTFERMKEKFYGFRQTEKRELAHLRTFYRDSFRPYAFTNAESWIHSLASTTFEEPSM